MSQLPFNNKILILGLGSIARCLLPILANHIAYNPKKLTVLESGNNKENITDFPGRDQFNYYHIALTDTNLGQILTTLVGPGDLVINLTSGVDAISVMGWCNANSVLYVDSSLEPWAESYSTESIGKEDKTHYWAHLTARKAQQTWKTNTTAVVTHGANPGMVSHFVKAALLLLADKKNIQFTMPTTQQEWAELCKLTETQVIQISEYDSQVCQLAKPQDEFWNTWSIQSYWGEALCSAEIGWGTHEETFPRSGHTYSQGSKNAIYLDEPSEKTLVKSWVPSHGEITAYLVTHSETITISDYLSCVENNKVTYRPTTFYAYHPSVVAARSLSEMAANNWNIHPKTRIINDEITSGIDELGVLLLSKNNVGIWYGSQLSIESTRNIIPHQNATTLQVVAGVISAVIWAIKNPNHGYCEPEKLPFNEILKIAEPYLKPIVHEFTNWRPNHSQSLQFSDFHVEKYIA